MRSHTSRAWLEVDLAALRRNAELLGSRAGVPLVPMVKADAYGLGAVRVSRALEPLDPYAFGVATVAEGVELREAGIARRILVFTPVSLEELAELRAARLTPTLGSARQIECWADGGGGDWHLAIDTGMSRAGIRWDEVSTLGAVLERHPPAGAFTHFHSAELNDGSLEVQERRFLTALDRLPARPVVLHAENSPALERRRPSPWSIARPGVFLYGVGGGAGAEVRPEPVAHLRGRIVELRTIGDGETVSYDATYVARGARRVATVALGYGDGYRRALGNRGTALVHGQRAPVAGLVTMDMTMLDVSEIPCDVGDVATFLGRDGDLLLTVDDVASTAQMSPYELLTGLRMRVPRVYRDAGHDGVTGDA
jgi:alanine racemase